MTSRWVRCSIEATKRTFSDSAVNHGEKNRPNHSHTKIYLQTSPETAILKDRINERKSAKPAGERYGSEAAFLFHRDCPRGQLFPCGGKIECVAACAFGCSTPISLMDVPNWGGRATLLGADAGGACGIRVGEGGT